VQNKTPITIVQLTNRLLQKNWSGAWKRIRCAKKYVSSSIN